MKKVSSVDEYISRFPPETKKKLMELRALVKRVAPEAEEGISYMMPAYKLSGVLVYFAGYEHHIGFYPGASGIGEFQEEISKYKNGKGSVQFPLDQPLPVKLIERIVRHRRKTNLEKKKRS